MNKYGVPIKRIVPDEFSDKKSELYENVENIVLHFKNRFKITDYIEINTFYKGIEVNNINTLDELITYIKKTLSSYKNKELDLNQALIYKRTDNFEDFYKQIEYLLTNYPRKFGFLQYCLDEINNYIKDTSREFTSKFFNTLNNEFEVFLKFNYNKIKMILIILRNNSLLKRCYKGNIPFREDKYLLKFKTFEKKVTKLTPYPAPIREYLILLRNRLEELLGFNFNHNETKRGRDRIKIRNEVLDEFIDLVVCDNYIKDSAYKKDIRASNKSDKFLEEHNQLIDDAIRDTSNNSTVFISSKNRGISYK